MSSEQPLHEVDVVVVGGGGAGLAAAVAASAEGAKVALLEKNTQLGGTTGLAIGSFTAPCTSFQRAAGIEDSPEAHNEDIGKFAPHLEQFNDGDLRLHFTQHSGETLEWLLGLGIEFYGPSPEPPNRVPRMHNIVPNAKAYVATMQKRALKQGVVIRTGRRADKLLVDDADSVTGVVATDEETGVEETWRARRGVVLAAGDYANGYEMKKLFCPEEVASIEGINPLATGDGHRMAMAIGAGTSNMDVIYGPEIRFIPPPREPFTQLLPPNPLLAKLMGFATNLMPQAVLRAIIKRLLVTWQHPETSMFDKGAILVNARGERFVDETKDRELAIPAQPDKIAFIVIDSTIAQVFSEWPNYISTAPDIAYAYVQDYRRLRPDVYSQAATWAGLAAETGVDADTLERTITLYNEAARGKTPDPFGRSTFGPPLTQPPFIALGPAKSWIVTTEGGLRVNKQLQVLREDGGAIGGLYAAGCTGLGGMVMWGHGLHIAWAVTSGRMAGQNAAGD